MFAPTASQMLRDDQRLRDLHRDTIRRRKRHLARQKRLQDEEEKRRMNALKRRRNERNRHLSAFRKQNHRNNSSNKAIRARRNMAKITKTKKQNDVSSFMVPVCDQLCDTNIKKKKEKKIRPPLKQKVCETKTDLEFPDNEKEEFEYVISDEQSIAELDQFEMKHFGTKMHINSTNVLMTTQSNNGYQQLSLYNINDIDMKTPEDNDSVKINPKHSVDCSKTGFSTIYNSNLLPLQSILESKSKRRSNSHQTLIHKYQSKRRPKRVKSYYSEQNCDVQSMNKSYGIKLPRLTQSILKEKERRDSKQAHSPKSTFSAPNDIGYNLAKSRRRQTTTIIDDFFTNDDGLDALESHRTSNNTMFLPKINRSKLKPKSRVTGKPAYSVMSQYDVLREEQKLEQSLLRINETLSNLALNEPKYSLRQQTAASTRNRNRNHTKQLPKYPNYLNDTKVSSIPRKIKVKKSPTFKSKRRRRRWNI